MKKSLIATVTAAALTFGALAPAMAQETAADYAKVRSENYKAASAEMKNLTKALKGNRIDVAAVKASAEKVADALEKATNGYVQGMAEADESDAKKTIWSETEKFQGLAKDSIAAAQALASAETATDRNAAMATLGGSCKACHDVYRNK